MTKELLLHQNTDQSLESFLINPSHALIIEGKRGAGKNTLANYLSAKLLGIPADKLANFPQILRIEPDRSSISITEIRQAQQFLKLRTTGRSYIRRILIVYEAELMTIEAQNAFLKILEEPPPDTVILILTSQKIKLLPTIRSRTQSMTIKSVNKTETDKYFTSKGYEQTSITMAYHAANGQIGLMTSLLTDDEASHDFYELKLAKEVLAMTKLQRLGYVEVLNKQKDDIPSFIRALAITSQAALKQTIARNDFTQAKRWHKNLELSVDAEAMLVSNPNSKLMLTNLLLNL